MDDNCSQVEDAMEEPELQRIFKGTVSQLSSSIFVHFCPSAPSFLISVLLICSLTALTGHFYVSFNLAAILSCINLVKICDTGLSFNHNPPNNETYIVAFTQHINIAFLLFPLLSWLDVKLFKNLLHHTD